MRVIRNPLKSCQLSVSIYLIFDNRYITVFFLVGAINYSENHIYIKVSFIQLTIGTSFFFIFYFKSLLQIILWPNFR